jgi:hypothetical protein
MRTFFILLNFALLIYICACSEPEKRFSGIKYEEGKVIVIPTFRGRYFHDNDKDSSTFFLFDVKLINHSKSQIEFWTLTCSPSVNVLIDSDQLNFFIPECSGNSIKIIKLNPNQEFLMPIVLQYSGIYKDINSPIRFGFIIDKPKYKGLSKQPAFDRDPRDELYEMRKSKKNVIWSEPVDLFSTNNYLYEIRTIMNDSIFSSTPRKKLINS